MDIDNIIKRATTIFSVRYPNYILARTYDDFHVEHNETGEVVEGLETTEALISWLEKNEAIFLEGLAAEVRSKRGKLLAACDWTQLLDVREEVREAYAVYRQVLRDIPQQEGFPTEVVFPEPPRV